MNYFPICIGLLTEFVVDMTVVQHSKVSYLFVMLYVRHNKAGLDTSYSLRSCYLLAAICVQHIFDPDLLWIEKSTG
jgi:hypothetical protein